MLSRRLDLTIQPAAWLKLCVEREDARLKKTIPGKAGNFPYAMFTYAF